MTVIYKEEVLNVPLCRFGNGIVALEKRIKKVKNSLKKGLTFWAQVCIIARPRSFLG